MLTYHRILVFWKPLVATWIMMSVEVPFLSAVIARLPDTKENLAAFGVAYSFALIFEAPILMIMSSSATLVRDKDSFLTLRNFTYALNGVITLLMVILLLPPIFYTVTEDLIGFSHDVARLAHMASMILLPWPSTIGYRRFYQGVLIRHNLTRLVAYGTIVRVVAMAGVALVLYGLVRIEGVLVGAVALSSGVTLEAFASRLMARSSVRELTRHGESTTAKTERLTYGFITLFYYPLALTSVLTMAVHPMVPFFIGKSRLGMESLAVLPVVNALVSFFRSFGMSYQEVGVVLISDKKEDFVALNTFALLLGLGTTGGLFLMTFTPLATLWFYHLSGLSKELASLAISSSQWMVLLPGLTVLLSFQRSLLLISRQTAPITVATILEIIGIAGLIIVTIRCFDMPGAIAAGVGFLIGRLLATAYLCYPFMQILKARSFIAN